MKAPLRTVSAVLLSASVLLALGGCAEKNVQIAASSDGRNAFEDPVQRPGVSMSGATLSREASRPPFVTLSSYDWDYADWLDSFTEAIGALRLPDSKDVSVQLVFRPDQDLPDTAIDCAELSAADCELLHAEIDNLRGLPPLPEHETMTELVVKLSRLP